MFYLRTITNGIESNLPIGEQYAKVDILKLSYKGEAKQLIEELIGMQCDLPESNIVLFPKGMSFNGSVVIYPGPGAVHYIVDERGNTFDTLRPVYIMFSDFEEDKESWAYLLDKWDREKKQSVNTNNK